VQRIEKRVEEAGLDIWDESLYKNESGRRQKELLSEEQKECIIEITTSSRANREKESWQAIADGDFKDVIPKISTTTFENVIYNASYSRQKPS
jgi:hypothetical protein